MYFFARFLALRKPFHELFLPFYYAPMFTYLHQPLEAMTFKALEEGSKFYPYLPQLFHALLPAPFAFSVYLFFRESHPQRISFLVAFLTLLSFPSLYLLTDLTLFDFMGTTFLYLSLFFLLRAHHKKSSLFPFALFLLLGGLVREPSAVHAILLPTIYLLYCRRSGSPFQSAEKALMIVGIPLFLLYLLPSIFLPAYPPKHSLRVLQLFQLLFQHGPIKALLALFLAPQEFQNIFHRTLLFFPTAFISNGLQIGMLIFPSGMLLFCLSVLSPALHRRTGNLFPFLLLCLSLFILLLPPLAFFDYYGSIYLSPLSPLVFLFLLFLAGCVGYLREQTILSFYAGASLASWLVISIAAILIAYTHEDVSGRHFLPIAPFVYYLFLNSLARLKESARHETGFTRVFLLCLLVYTTLAFSYNIFAHSQNQIQEYRGRLRAMFHSKLFLAKNIKNDDFVFYINRSFSTGGGDLETLYPAISAKSYGHAYLNAVRKGSPKAISKEICYKADYVPQRISIDLAAKKLPFLGYPQVPAKHALWIHSLNSHLGTPLPNAKKLVHDYKWLENGFDFGTREPYHLTTGWDYNQPALMSHLRYRSTSDLDRICSAYGERVYRYRYPFTELPFPVETLIQRTITHIPLRLPMAYRGDLCRINIQQLRCDHFNFFPIFKSKREKPWDFLRFLKQRLP